MIEKVSFACKLWNCDLCYNKIGSKQ